MWNVDESKILSWVWWWTSGSPSGTIHVWDVATHKEILTLPPKRRFGAIWNAEGNRILVLDSPSILDATTGKEIFPVRRQRAWVSGAAWNRDESQILFWADDSFLRVWNALTGEEKLRVRYGKGNNVIIGAMWNQAENQILAWSDDRTARVWDAGAGQEKLTLTHDRIVNGATWNKDGTRILSWSNDGTARLWDATTGEQTLVFRHDNTVNSASWNVDESLILSCSDDGTVRVWNATTGEQALILQHGGSVNGAIWSPD